MNVRTQLWAIELDIRNNDSGGIYSGQLAGHEVTIQTRPTKRGLRATYKVDGVRVPFLRLLEILEA